MKEEVDYLKQPYATHSPHERALLFCIIKYVIYCKSCHPKLKP